MVKDTEKRSRNSWVVWEEYGRYPDLMIELPENRLWLEELELGLGLWLGSY